MKLTFVIGDTLPLLWIDGPLPFQKKRDWRVRVRLNNAKSTSHIPSFGEIGELLIRNPSSPPRHAVMLVLAYLKAYTPPSTAQSQPRGWIDVSSSPIYDQIHIALSAEAIAEIQESDAADSSFELTLDDIELEPAAIPTIPK